MRGPRWSITVDAVIYARFSPRPNPEDCLSCDRQIEDARELCQRLGWNVKSCHQDPDTSGVDKFKCSFRHERDEHGVQWTVVTTRVRERDGLAAAIADLRPGNILLVRAPDRLSRDVQLAGHWLEQIEQAGARLATVESGGVAYDPDNPDDEMVRTILWAIAQNKRAKTRKTTRSRMRIKQALGHKMSSISPYGWRDAGQREETTPSGITRVTRVLERDPDEQANIEEIVRLHGQGLGPRAVARAMNERQRTCRGGRWYHGTVRSIIRRATEVPA
jgi:DNA invertase Pin-like site-specific DNA recombinase